MEGGEEIYRRSEDIMKRRGEKMPWAKTTLLYENDFDEWFGKEFRQYNFGLH